MSEENIRQIYQVLGILDGYAATLACEQLTDRDYTDLEFYIGTMDLAVTDRKL